MLTVTKRSGVSEPFSRSKIVTGVRKACQGRPVSDDDLRELATERAKAVRDWLIGREVPTDRVFLVSAKAGG